MKEKEQYEEGDIEPTEEERAETLTDADEPEIIKTTADPRKEEKRDESQLELDEIEYQEPPPPKMEDEDKKRFEDGAEEARKILEDLKKREQDNEGSK